MDTPNNTINDTYCREETTAPRLTFQAHMAPDDVKFNDSGNEAWVTFHGSHDRDVPVGYKVSVCCLSPAFFHSRSLACLLRRPCPLTIPYLIVNFPPYRMNTNQPSIPLR